MFNKLFRKKPQNNNEIRSAVVLKSDIGDFGNYNHNVDGSFYSYQSNNASFSMNPSSPKSIQSDLSPRKIALNQNFCSIFNVPPSNKVNKNKTIFYLKNFKKKNAFFNQVYQTLSNKINKSMELPNLEPKDLSKFDISQESFQLYTSNIKSVLE